MYSAFLKIACSTGVSHRASTKASGNLTISINGVVTTVLAGEKIGKDVLVYSTGFTSIIITTTGAYRLWVYN